jgi:uncharacterized protein with HEPN domain
MTDESRLAEILERIDRIARATANGRSTFMESEVIQDAVIRNLEVIGEAAKSVGSETRTELARVPWREMARFRDLANHQYGQVLADEVWDIVAKDLPAIRRAISRGGPRRSPRK